MFLNFFILNHNKLFFLLLHLGYMYTWIFLYLCVHVNVC
uniref:Uncharacterized protein n=1 Tax=Anguilla anguilla TaxID=7936 RepID=A0A0E9QN97_ANGAN